MNDDELYQGYLTKVYQNTQGYQGYSEQERDLFLKAGVCVTYGELLYPSVKKLIKHFNYSSDDILLDLGSGLGKFALQVFLQTDIKKVIGIEASSVVNSQAQVVKEQVAADFPEFWENARELDFICDDFIKASWQDATIVYTCSTCFTQELLIAIGNKINHQPKVRQVFSLRPLSSLKMRLKSIFVVECSWDSALCFYYER
ncbi:MAG TPA: hypothetical protein VHE99_08610 [Gammaproteobacteria bacterium]|nr:hypothetical protein [Gammaproteobacteria bacterium]